MCVCVCISKLHIEIPRHAYLQNTHTNTQTHYHIDLSIGVSHVADDAAILHPVELFSGNNILVTCKKKHFFSKNSNVMSKQSHCESKSWFQRVTIAFVCWKPCDYQSRSNACRCMGRSTSASYHHVHLPDDLTQLDHSEAVHAVWIRRDIFISLSSTNTAKNKWWQWIALLESQLIWCATRRQKHN